MRILAIESSGMVASVAVMNDGVLEGETFLNHKLQHSVVLFPMIQDTLKKLEITISDIDAVAVSRGPGSFTGLRIGVAAAKGIAQGGHKKFIAVSSLDSLAFQQTSFGGLICPIMDALRQNVYTAVYSWKDGKLVKEMDYDAIHINDLLEKLAGTGKDVMFCGGGVAINKDAITARMGEKAYFAPAISMMPRASSMADIADIRLREGKEDSIYTFGPMYIRKSQAEREYEKRMK